VTDGRAKEDGGLFGSMNDPRKNGNKMYRRTGGNNDTEARVTSADLRYGIR